MAREYDQAAGAAFDATVNYVDPAQIGKDGLTFNFDQAWSGIPVDSRMMRIADAAALETPPSLETHGFQTIRIACPDLADLPRDEIEQHWVPAVRDALQELTGADAVASWAFSMRFSERKADAPHSEVSNPARRVHADFSPAEFGHGIYGVGAASERFFHISPARLDAQQAALLAAVLPNPARLLVARPSAYVRRRAAWIQRQASQLGGAAYLPR